MAKITLLDVSNLLGNPTSAANTINENNTRIEAALETLLSRDGTTPNQFEVDLDLDHNDLMNVGNLQADEIKVDGIDLSDRLQEVVDAKDEALDAAIAAGISESNAASSATSAGNSALSAAASALSAAQSVLQAAANASIAIDAAEASGDIKFFDTNADAVSALGSLPEGQVVEVFIDETENNHRVRYRVESGVLVKKLDFLDGGSKFEVATFDLLETDFSYSVSTARRDVSVGDIISVANLDARYEVVSALEVDPDLDYSGTGGIRLNVLRKGNAFFTTHFGAAGDGVTDDTTIVQRVVNKGGLIILSNHFVTDTIQITQDGTILEGTGKDSSSISLDVDVDEHVLESVNTGLSDIVLRNFKVTGNWVDVNRIQGSHCVVMRNISRLRIDGLFVTESKEFGMLLHQCSDTIVGGTRIESSGINRDGCKLLTCHNVTVTGCVIKVGDDCVSVSGEGTSSSHVTISACVFESDYARAVYINTTQSNPGPVGNVTVTGCIISSTDSAGIFVDVYDGEEKIRNITITGCVFTNFGMKANNSNGAAWGVRVRGSALNPVEQVAITGCVFVIENVPTDQVGIGIIVTFARGVLVANNMILFLQTVAAESSGIQIGSDGEGVFDFMVVGNYVDMRGHGSYGIHIQRSSRGSIIFNRVLSAPTTGIRGSGDVAEPCNYITVRFNSVYDPLPVPVMQRSIRSEGTGDYWTIEFNEIRDAAISPSITFVGSNNKIRQNEGFVTSNSGTATIASGNTEVQVSHGLNITPSIANISVTSTDDMGSATKFHFHTVTGGSFKIAVNTAPGGSGATFSWQIRD